jgi:DNA processing protein
MNRLEACLYLRFLPGIGPVKEQKLLAHFSSPEAIFDASDKEWTAVMGVGKNVLKTIRSWKQFKTAVKEQVALLEQNQIRSLFWGDDNYPETLAFCPDAPLVLFSKGTLDIDKTRKIISVVGTRENTPYGKKNCESLIRAVAPYNPIICSGFAFGTDIIAHRAALDYGLDTIACLAHGFDKLYPKEHAKYCKSVEAQGAFFSDCLFGEAFDKGSFPRRNRIIAGLGHTTIVVESGVKGGSMNTADLAHQYGRELFALPGRISDPKSKGCHLLIQQHKAMLLTTPDQVLETLQFRKKVPKKAIQKQLFVSLSVHEKEVLACLSVGEKKHLDALAIDLQKEVRFVASVLMTLEMKGCVNALPGKYFELV